MLDGGLRVSDHAVDFWRSCGGVSVTGLVRGAKMFGIRLLEGVRKIFENPKLQNKDIREWSNSEERVIDNCEENEVVAEIPELGIWVCVFKTEDKRGASDG